MRERGRGRGLGLAVGLVYAFLLLPLVIVVLSAFNAGNYLTFPPQGFSLRWFENFLRRREFLQATWLSVELGIWTALASTVIGTLAAIALVRGRFLGRDLLSAYVTSPLLLPQILTGVALLQFFSLAGMAQTYWALLLGHVVVTTPYVVRTVSATLYNFDIAVEEAAQSLGASPVRAFLEVTLGLVKPGVVAGAIFAFAVSFDNFTISLFLTSPQLTPLPIELFAYLKYSFDPTAAAASAVAIGLTLVVVLLLAWIGGLEELTGF
ncbi:MAG: ABC transporter permease [Candidatus Rokuibacteriota bacterium]